MKKKFRWKKQILALKDNHAWEALPGYEIFVADRGAVRFNFPKDWFVKPASDCIELYDQKPPNDNCRLAVSYLRLPPVDWSGLPLSELIESAVKDDRRNIISRSKITNVPRDGIEVVWTEVCFIATNEPRAAYSRLALARGSNLQALITFDFWADDAKRLSPVWNEVVRSVELGMYIKDPTKGDTNH